MLGEVAPGAGHPNVEYIVQHLPELKVPLPCFRALAINLSIASFFKGQRVSVRMHQKSHVSL